MKRNLLRIGIAVAGTFVALLLSQVAPPAPQKLSEFVPAGPLLYLEAKDFASLLSRWSASQENQRWLQSANYTAFSQSHLYMRLIDAYNEYAAAVGFAPDAAMLQSIAGSESGLAVYDIGKLEFLYLTRLPSAKATETTGPREGTKTAQVVAMLQRKNGATLEEIMSKMAWQKHTVRGFMAGAMKKAGYTVESFKSDKGERTYRLNS